MNNRSTSLLIDPHPCGHIVYPYTDETHVTEAVAVFAGAGLSRNEGVILVMSADHCTPIRKRLEIEGYDVDALESSGQLACEEAESLMEQFMVGGMPDETLFKNAIAPIIERAARSADGGRRPVRVFGEMVSLLWGDDTAAADRLEQLWNDVIETHSVALLCTYSLNGRKQSSLPHELLRSHSHCITGVNALGTGD
jgi:hypothetical protein